MPDDPRPWMRVGLAYTFALGLVSPFLVGAIPWAWPWKLAGMGFALVPAIFFVGLAWWKALALSRWVHERGDRVCPSCYHDLNGIGRSGKCPECGLNFDRASLKEAWARPLRGVIGGRAKK